MTSHAQPISKSNALAIAGRLQEFKVLSHSGCTFLQNAIESEGLVRRRIVYRHESYSGYQLPRTRQLMHSQILAFVEEALIQTYEQHSSVNKQNSSASGYLPFYKGKPFNAQGFIDSSLSSNGSTNDTLLTRLLKVGLLDSTDLSNIISLLIEKPQLVEHTMVFYITRAIVEREDFNYHKTTQKRNLELLTRVNYISDQALTELKLRHENKEVLYKGDILNHCSNTRIINLNYPIDRLSTSLFQTLNSLVPRYRSTGSHFEIRSVPSNNHLQRYDLVLSANVSGRIYKQASRFDISGNMTATDSIIAIKEHLISTAVQIGNKILRDNNSTRVLLILDHLYDGMFDPINGTGNDERAILLVEPGDIEFWNFSSDTFNPINNIEYFKTDSLHGILIHANEIGLMKRLPAYTISSIHNCIDETFVSEYSDILNCMLPIAVEFTDFGEGESAMTSMVKALTDSFMEFSKFKIKENFMRPPNHKKPYYTFFIGGHKYNTRVDPDDETQNLCDSMVSILNHELLRRNKDTRLFRLSQSNNYYLMLTRDQYSFMNNLNVKLIPSIGVFTKPE